MATKMAKTTDSTTTASKAENTKPAKQSKVERDPEELIMCRSNTSGGLYVEGNRSKYVYTWADYNDVVGVEYRDLVFMIRSNDKTVFEPRIIIEDDEIIEQFKQLQNLYESLYNVDDLTEVLNLPVRQMKDVIENMPKGAKEALKGIAATMISEHRLDSISKVKTLDEIFNTKLLLTLAEN